MRLSLAVMLTVKTDVCGAQYFARLLSSSRRPTAKPADRNKNGKFDVGIADDQASSSDWLVCH